MLYYIDAQSLHESGMTVVKDDHSRPAFILNGRHGLANDSFNLHTISGQDLGEIRQKAMGMSPRYDLVLDGRKAGSVKKMLGVWHEFVFVTDLNWIIFGNLLANEYRIYHGVKTVTTIAAVGAATSTTFKIDILDPRNVHAGLLVAAVLDRWRFVHLTNPLTRGSLAYGTEG